MNCREFRGWLQERLDVGQWPANAEPHAHLAECDACRRDFAAARVLLDGVARLPKAVASPLMTASIAAAVADDRVARRRRSTYRWFATAGLAASVLLLLGLGWIPIGSPVKQPAVVENVPPPTKKSGVELALRAGEAQKAVASLTRTVAESTSSRVGALLPSKESLGVEFPALPAFDEPLDPAAKSLKLAGLSVAHAFDPVASTTARAFDFFAREIPAFDPSKN